MIELKRDIRRKRLLNLTPLIDIIFLLVVFFLLSSKFEFSSGIVLSVKGEEKETIVKDVREEDTYLYVLDDYTIEYKNIRYSLSDYIIFFDTELADKAIQSMHILSYENVSVQTVVTLMDELKARSVSQVQLVKVAQ